MATVTVDDDALLGALAAFRALPKEVRSETAQAVRGTLKPVWGKIIATRERNAQRTISPRQDALAGAGAASFTAAGRGTLKAYHTKRSLSGGMSTDQWPFVEFGTLRARYAGTRLPRFTPGGRIAYPAVKSWAPTAASVYLGVLADVLRDLPGAGDA